MKHPVLACVLPLLVAPAAPAQSPFKDLWVRMVNPEIEVQLRHPPSLGLAVKRLAFLPGGNEASLDLVAACVMDLTAKGEIDVVDRANLDAVIKEQNLGSNGYFDPETNTKMGKLLGAQALASVKVGHYKGSTVQLKKDDSWTDKEGKRHESIHYTSRTKVELVASVQVTDLVTGKVYMTQRVAASPFLDATSDKGYPDYPSELQVRELAIAQARTEVRHMFLAWTEPRRLVFFDDKDYGMKEAYQALKLHDADRALAKSRDSLDRAREDKQAKPKYLGRVNYNLGICLFGQGLHDEAVPYLQAAREADPESSVFKESLEECQRAIQLREEFRRVDQRSAEQRRKEGEPDIVAPRAEAKAPAPAPEAPKGSAEARLEKLNALRKKGLIDEQEYKQKKAEILKDM